jgi:TonB family protein
VLVLALIALLAAAPDAVTRIPGTKVSLGMTEVQLLALGEFPGVNAADAGAMTPRQGEASFFGVPCRATLYFRDGHLARAHFEAKEVAPHALDYVESQLRRSKLLRECMRFQPGDHACDWIGAVKIHLEIHQDQLDARVEWPLRPWEADADLAATASPTAAPPAVAPPAVAPPAVTPPAVTPPAVTPPAVTPPAVTAPRPSPTPPSPTVAPPTPPAPTRAPDLAAPPAVVPERAAVPVATLPETLRLSLPERNPPSDWPRMTLVPKLVYPEAARHESVQGVVWVLALVDTDGVVRSAQVDRGIRELNDAALAWVSQARFAPCVRDQRPCRFWIRVASRFTLY